MSQTTIPDVLASRYASAHIKDIFSEAGKIRLERQLWIAALEAQTDMGLPAPEGALAAYKACANTVTAEDLADIRTREATLRHDVKARLEHFNAKAGFDCLHRGFTSRDLTETAEQLQTLKGLKVITNKAAAAALALGEHAQQFKTLPITARTHNVPAQLTTLGKRFAMFGEELTSALAHLKHAQETYALRGLKGAVGTQLDVQTLFEGSAERAVEFEALVFEKLNATSAPLRSATGQVTPRSAEHALLSGFVSLAAGPCNFANTLRLMAGHSLATEGFAPGQVGSSAMPHKVNARSCERIAGFATLLRGYENMLSQLAGAQWNEGDVACSVVRRVALPSAFFAIDGLLETFLSILRNMQVHENAVASEVTQQLPFLLTTTFLMEAVKAGTGREAAHTAIKTHALAAAKALQTGQTTNPLPNLIANDESLPLNATQVDNILKNGLQTIGAAGAQTDAWLNSLTNLQTTYPHAAKHSGGDVL